jgi:pimeloyl-ACP methyl ester carboxylesterase
MAGAQRRRAIGNVTPFATIGGAVKHEGGIAAMVPAISARTLIAATAFLASLACGSAPGQAAPLEALGIALEGWSYPFPVEFHEFDLGRETVRQAYMDVAPAGVANGRTALLLHGRNFPASYWQSVIRALAENGYRVIATDQIGFGKSSKPDLAYTFDMFARNTASLLDRLGVGQVDVVGHSLGGMLATRFARTYPQRVRRLVLEAPVGLEDYRFSVPPVTDEFLYQREYSLSAAAYRDFLKNSYSLSVAPEDVEPFVDLRERLKLSGEYPRWVKSFVRSYQMIHDQPVVHEYPLVAMPTLFVMGSNDRTAPGKPYAPAELGRRMGENAENAKRIAASMPHAQVVVFEGVGHMPHYEQPERFNRSVVEFLAAD